MAISVDKVIHVALEIFRRNAVMSPVQTPLHLTPKVLNRVCGNIAPPIFSLGMVDSFVNLAA